jgi:hypothetical protein
MTTWLRPWTIYGKQSVGAIKVHYFPADLSNDIMSMNKLHSLQSHEVMISQFQGINTKYIFI